MRYLLVITVSIASFLTGCSVFQAKAPASPPVVPKKIVVPVGKNWQVVEEPPVLTNERHEQTLPFQRDPASEPQTGNPPVAPTEQRRIETPR